MTAEEEEPAFLHRPHNLQQRLSGVRLARVHGLDASVVRRGLSGAREIPERSLSHVVARRAGRPLRIVPPAARCG